MKLGLGSSFLKAWLVIASVLGLFGGIVAYHSGFSLWSPNSILKTNFSSYLSAYGWMDICVYVCICLSSICHLPIGIRDKCSKSKGQSPAGHIFFHSSSFLGLCTTPIPTPFLGWHHLRNDFFHGFRKGHLKRSCICAMSGYSGWMWKTSRKYLLFRGRKDGARFGEQALESRDSSCWGQREGLWAAPFWDMFGAALPPSNTHQQLIARLAQGLFPRYREGTLSSIWASCSLY